MNRRTIISLAIIFLAFAAIGGGTMAWFTDADEVDYNQFTAGTLLINIDGFEDIIVEEGKVVNPDRLNPGDEWCYEFLVENEGNKTFNWRLGLFWDEVIGRENLYNQTQEMVDALNARVGYGTEEISEVLLVTISKKVSGSWVEVYSGLLGSSSPKIWDNPVIIAPGETVEFKICFKLPTTAGNEYQGAKIQAGFAVQAWQTTNNAPAPGTFENPFTFWEGY